MTRQYKAAIVGASGFAGAELLRRLHDHPLVRVARICAADYVGEPVSRAHPNLEGLSDMLFENPPPTEVARDMDIVMMGVPADVSSQIVDSLDDREVRLVDMSGAFRLRDASTYEKYYGKPHPRPELLGSFVYGLPELNESSLRSATRVASPGCFATAIELGLLPFAQAGKLRGSVRSVAVTGSSGSGSTPSATTHHPTRAVNLRTYRPLIHQHSPEIIETLSLAGGEDIGLAFVPVSAPLTRGIFVSSFIDAPDLSAAGAQELLEQFYANKPFVRVPQGRLPEVVAVAGSNYAEVGVAADPDAPGTLAVFSALDNLVKGGAGQAVQSLNLMLGLPQTTCLAEPGMFP